MAVCAQNVPHQRISSPSADFWRPWQLPASMAYRRLDPTPFLDVAAPPWPLGTSGAWLPVTHVQARLQPTNQWWRASASHLARERGLWFYYAAGCSDLYYHAGTTLAARNRADAALRLAARCDLGGKGGGPSGGAAHVAAFLNATSLARGGNGLGKKRYLDALGAGDARLRRLAAVLREAARWPFFPRSAEQQHGGGDDQGGGGGGGGGANDTAGGTGQHRRQLRRGQRRKPAAAAAAAAAFEGAAPFCEPTFLKLRERRGEGGRAECGGRCALLELGAAIVLFDFLDECASQPRTRMYMCMCMCMDMWRRIAHASPPSRSALAMRPSPAPLTHLTSRRRTTQTCSPTARAAVSTRCSCSRSRRAAIATSRRPSRTGGLSRSSTCATRRALPVGSRTTWASRSCGAPRCALKHPTT